MTNVDPIFSYKNSRGEYFGLDFRLRNVRIRQRGFNSRKEARLVMETIRTQILLGKYDPYKNKQTREGNKLTLSDLFNQYVTQQTTRKSTKNQSISLFKVHLNKELGSIKINNVNTRRLNRTIQKIAETKSGSTTKAVYSLLKNLFNWAYKEDLVSERPELELPKIKPAKAKSFLTMDEIERLLTWLYEHESDFLPNVVQGIHTLALTGLRVGEMLALTPEDVDLDRKTLSINKTVYLQSVHKPKNGKEMDIPIHPQLELVMTNLVSNCLDLDSKNLFENVDTNNPYTPKTIRKAIKTAAKYALGINTGITPHTLRRSLSQYLMESGFSVSQISAMLRNSNEMVLRHYSESSLRTLSEAFPKLVLLNGMKGK